MKSKVALTRCLTYDIKKITAAVRQAAESAGGIELQGKKVLLKPNILRDAPALRAVTTHPEFVRACIIWAKEQGAARVMVGDSPAFQPGGFTGRKSGIRQVVEEEEAEWLDFSGRKCLREVSNPLVEGAFQLTAAVEEADCIISLPKLKTHQLMYYTGAMKNLFGLVQGLSKPPYHVRYPAREEFGKMIADLTEAVNADFAIMDAVTAMEGPGPGSGSPKEVGLVAAGSDLLALDMVMAGVIGYKAETLPSNRWGMEKPGAVRSMEEIEVCGLDRQEAEVKGFQLVEDRGSVTSVLGIIARSAPVRRLETKLRVKPRFVHERCIRCGECVQVCAAGALEMRRNKDGKKYVAVDYRACIRCYCCHEVCPANAITIGRKARSQ